ncbi:hypothetical protein PCASD_01572 [Puccinia coronata f. sp. avenae]|uniref:Uncharacterized protein n=1 Tax=Puccinia coronata f. sp. avenae TaxID=200324 RepID=A0A2N5VIJ1_9BASI|nr:hypothetical protein PCASD_01572 [Puccinia coronata f. sp. avenae]
MVPRMLPKRFCKRLRTNVSSERSEGVLPTLSLGKRPEDGDNFSKTAPWCRHQLLWIQTPAILHQ